MTEHFKTAIKGDNKIILDNYFPKDGLYIKIDREKPISQIDENRYMIIDTDDEIAPEKLDLYNWLKERDYCSQILNTNKAIDLPAKKILSANYLSYFIQKDRLPSIGKNPLDIGELKRLTENYYERLKNAESYFEDLLPSDIKFKPEKKEEEMENFLQAYYSEEVAYIRNDERRQDIEECKEYMLDNMEDIINTIKLIDDKSKVKGYIKIFFEEDIEKYRKESRVYLIPRIYNVKEYNILVNDEILGLPISDITTNEKKPYLLLKTMKCLVPIRDTVENVKATKNFYEWMLNSIKNEKDVFKLGYNYAFDGGKPYDGDKPYYIVNMAMSQSSKNYEIVDFDNIPSPLPEIRFKLENTLRVPLYDPEQKVYLKDKYEEDRTITNLSSIQYLVSQYYFNGEMKGYFKNIEPDIKSNKFTHEMKILFMESRDAFFDYFHKGIDTNIKKIIDKITLSSIDEQLKSTVEGTRLMNMRRAYNLRLSFLKYFKIEGGKDMASRLEDVISKIEKKINFKEMVYCNSDEEFYFLAGQLAYYLISTSEASKKHFGMFEPFLLARNSNQLKRRLEETFETYSHNISIGYIKFKNAMSMVMGYQTETKITDEMKGFLIAGILSNNLLYSKQEGDNNEDGK
jgi:CRISPR-associated protein Csh1